MPGYDTSVWYAFFAPAGVPAAKLNSELRNVLTSAEMREWLRTTGGLDVVASSAEELKTWFAAEIERWASIIRTSRIKMD